MVAESWSSGRDELAQVGRGRRVPPFLGVRVVYVFVVGARIVGAGARCTGASVSVVVVGWV